MRKLFTLIAVAMMAMSANAKLVLTEIKNAAFGIPEDGKVAAWDWKQAGTNDSQSHEEPEGSGNWITDKEATYNYGDASEYDYAVITFDELTCDVKFFVVNGGWASQPNVTSLKAYKFAAMNMAENNVVKGSIDAFVLQPTSDGNVKIKEIAYMTADEYAAFEKEAKNVKAEEDLKLPGEAGVITMEEGEDKSGWYSPGWVGKSGLNTVYKTLVFEIASATAPYALKVQGSEDGSTWDDSGFSSFEVAAHTAPAVIALPVEGKHVNLGQFAFQNLNVTETWQDQGKDVSWYDENIVTVTRIYLTSDVVKSSYPSISAIQNITTASNANNAVYNLAGQRVANAKGIVIKNGAKYVVK